MDLCGEFVIHKVFGKGQIINADNSCITVQFGNHAETKRFIFPSAFGTFLTPESESISKQVQDYKDELARIAGDNVIAPVERELPRKTKKPAARKPKK